MKFQMLIKTKMLIKTTFAFKLLDAVLIMLINVKMPTILGILTSMSRINFMLSWVEHEKKFYNLKAWLFTLIVFLLQCEYLCLLVYKCLFLVVPWVVQWSVWHLLVILTGFENTLYKWTQNFINTLYRGSYTSAHVLLNLLNELGKRDKMWSLPGILSLFPTKFNKFNNTRAWMLDSIYHMK